MISFVVATFLMLLLIPIMNTDANTTLVPDDGLREAINAELGKPADHEPTSAELQTLITLDASVRGISNLSGLQHAIMLEELNLRNNQITSIGEIGNLGELTKLNLMFNNISDARLSPLTNLPDLKELYLYANNIADVSILGTISTLTNLDVGSNPITDIQSLGQLTNLTALNLSNARQLNTAQLDAVNHVTSLGIMDTNLSDLSPLSNFTNLTTLSVGHNHVSDLSPLNQLNQLNRVIAPHNQVQDLSNATNLVNGLSELNLKDQMITRAEEVLQPSVTSLTIANTITDESGSLVDQITPSDGGTYQSPDVTWNGLTNSDTERSYQFEHTLNNGDFSGIVKQPISWVQSVVPDDQLRKAINAELGKPEDYEPTINDLESLTALDASATNVTNLEGLQYATNLKRLNISANRISDFGPIAQLTQLEELDAYTSAISDLTFITNLNHLTSLNVYNNDIADVSILANLTKLKHLNVSRNEIDSIEPLEPLTSIEILYISSNNISDLSPLNNLTKLERLYAGNNVIESVSALHQHHQLTGVNVRNNAITDLSPLAYVADQLKWLDATNQKITLGVKNIFETTTSMFIRNMVTGLDGQLVSNITPSDSGVYNEPRIAWAGLIGFVDTERSFQFSHMISNELENDLEFSGTVIQPINWVENTSPVISADDRTIQVGDSFDPLEGVTANDAEDGDITVHIQVIQNDVNVDVPGQYQVAYRVVDSHGGTDDKTITVTVEEIDGDNPIQNEPPQIDAHDKTIAVGSDFDPLDDVTASDAEDGDLTDELKVIQNDVDTDVPGAYDVVYEVTDSADETTRLSIVVTVEAKEKENPEEEQKDPTKESDEQSNKTDVKKDPEDEEGTLPKTATSIYNWLLVGVVCIVVGLSTVVIRRRMLKQQ
nr:leucine-rich repeat domain-containing protein [Lentibacillus saliphilus]